MIPKLDFGRFLLSENSVYLSQKTGDILSALQSLHDDSERLGTRPLLKASQEIVNQIRRILNDNWPDTESPILKTLQKIGVAISKAIDENAELKDVIASAVQELESVAGESGEPVNDIGSEGEQQDDN